MKSSHWISVFCGSKPGQPTRGTSAQPAVGWAPLSGDSRETWQWGAASSEKVTKGHCWREGWRIIVYGRAKVPSFRSISVNISYEIDANELAILLCLYFYLAHIFYLSGSLAFLMGVSLVGLPPGR